MEKNPTHSICRPTFADVIDEWIAWQRQEALPDYVEPSVKQFLGVASWEFRN